jgi:MFS family permease
MRDPSVNVLISEHGGSKTIASAFAWYSTAKVVSGAIGRSAAGILLTLTDANYRLVFITAFVLSALPIFVIARFVEGTHAQGHQPVRPTAPIPEEEAPPAEGKPSVFRAFGFGVLITGTATMLGNLFPLLATQYAGLTEAEAGLVYLVSVMVILFAGPLFGWLSDHVSRNLVLSIRGFANTVSSLLYILFPGFWGVMSARVIDDMGKAAFRPAWGELMARISATDKSRRARTLGRMSLAENIGETSGPLIAGFLWHTWGITTMLAVRAVLAVVTELYAVFVMEAPGRKGGIAHFLRKRRAKIKPLS